MEKNSTSLVRGPHNSTSNRLHAHQLNLHLTSILLILIPILLILLLLSILILAIMFRRLQLKKNQSIKTARITDKNCNLFAHHTTFDITESPDMSNSGCVSVDGSSRQSLSQRRSRGVEVFTYRELQVATNNFSEGNVIGNGGFGVVYRGVLMDGTVAAIKMLHKQGERAFRIQVDLLSRLHSPYLVELLGYCADQHHRLLVFEFMINGSLQHHLLRSPQGYPPSLDWGTRLRIALDCARALEFLHEHASPPIIHRDFKCNNILLDHNFRAKVSDFSQAKMGSDKINGQISTRVLGTTGYLAPEFVHSSCPSLIARNCIVATSIFGNIYGVVLLQLITGRVPVDMRRPPGEHVLVSWVAAIAAVCVQAEADYRPLMTDVVQSLIPLIKSFSFPSNSSSTFQSG